MSSIPSSVLFKPIGRFKPVYPHRTLGEGVSGPVRLYQDETGVLVAVKSITKSTNSISSIGLTREVAALKRLDHPNILRLIQVVEDVSQTHLITNYVADSIELFDYLIGLEVMGPDLAMKVFGQLVMALIHCHEKNVAHRDLKLENILINTKTKKITLIDFGLAREIPKEPSGKNSLVKTSCGSLHYASPEICLGNEYDPQKNEVWTLGVVLYILLIGSFPFDDKNNAMLSRKIIRGEFQIPNFIIEDLAKLVRAMIVVEPDKRLTLDQIINYRICQEYKHYFTPEQEQTPNLVKTDRDEKSRI